MAHNPQSWHSYTDPVQITPCDDQTKTTGARKNGSTRGRHNPRPAPFSRSGNRLENEQGNAQGANLLGSSGGSIAIHDGEFNATAGSRISVTINAGEKTTPPTQKPRKRKKPTQSGTTVTQDKTQASTTDCRQSWLRRTSFETYYLNLSTKGRGSPLWIPGPNRRLPAEYQKTGVRIGDVGIITSQGSFDFLFNILSPQEHPINSNGVPKDFVPLHLSDMELREHSAYPEDSYLSSDSIKRTYPSNNSLELAFESTASEGAVLTMPVGSNSGDVGNMLRLRRYAKMHAESWYKHVILDRGREVKNGDVRLVTGYDKTSAWGMAAFANSDESYGPLHMRFTGSENDSKFCKTYSWECSGVAEVRAGPGVKETEALRTNFSDPEGKQYENQCLFIRTLNITFQKDVWQQLKADCDYIDDPEDEDGSDSTYFSSQGGSPFGQAFATSSANSMSSAFRGAGSNGLGHTYNTTTVGSSSLPTNIFTPLGTLSIHPSAVLNNLLLSSLPTAKMAITEDRDWISLIKEDDRILPSKDEMCARVHKCFDFSENQGMAIMVKLTNLHPRLPRGKLSADIMQVDEKSLLISSSNDKAPVIAIASHPSEISDLIQVPTQLNHSLLFSNQVPYAIFDHDEPTTPRFPCVSCTVFDNRVVGSFTKPIVTAFYEPPSSSQIRIYERHIPFGTTGILQDHASALPSVFLPDPCPHLRPPRPPPPRPSRHKVLGSLNQATSITQPSSGILTHSASLQSPPLFDTGLIPEYPAAEIPGKLRTSVPNSNVEDEEMELADYTSYNKPNVLFETGETLYLDEKPLCKTPFSDKAPDPQRLSPTSPYAGEMNQHPYVSKMRRRRAQ